MQTQRGSGLRIAQRYALNDSVYDGSDEIDNPGAQERFWTTDLTGFYSVPHVAGLLLSSNIPIRVTEQNGHLHFHEEDREIELENDQGSAAGIGDVSLLARYTFLAHHTLDSTLLLAATTGVKLPTGDTDARTDAGDEFLDAHTQLGTGSTDLLAGASFNYALQRAAISGNALGGITGEGEVGDVDHRFGDWLNYDLTGRYRVYPETIGNVSTSVFLSFGVAGELRGKEKEGGETLADTGGHTVYLTPGVQVNFGEHWVAELSYHHAVYHDLNAVQLGEDLKVFGSITYLF
ncbi:MAG: hypothetical protein ACT4NU_04975 [Chromatiales bacterium]